MGAPTKVKVKQVDGLGDLALLDEITAALISDASPDGKNLIKAADPAAMRGLLGLVLGTDVQAQSANLNTFAGITPSANVQSLLAAASYAAMKTLLGLAAIASSGSASDLASGTVPMARLNVGTAANQLVQLNASGKLPAVDGSLLTNIGAVIPSYLGVGAYIYNRTVNSSTSVAAGDSLAGSGLYNTPSGTWKNMCPFTVNNTQYGILLRVA